MGTEYTFKVDKECKHSRRYAAEDKECPLSSVYVNRKFADKKDEIVITLK